MAEKGVFKRCGCTESVLDESGEPVLDGRGRPKRRELGSACPSLSKRAHGTWWFQCEVAPEPGSGKQRRRLRRGGFATKGDAEHVRNKIVGSERRGGDRHMPNDQLTTGEWLAQWIGARRNPRPATMRSYRGHIDNYLAPHLGHLRLTALRPHHIRAMFDKIEERNAEIEKALTANPRRTRGSKALPDEVRESRRVCGPASQQRIRATLRKALNDAMGQGLITTNAAVHVEMASGQAPRALIWTPQRVAEWRATGVVPSRVMVWRPDQCGEFLDYARFLPSRLVSVAVLPGGSCGRPARVSWFRSARACRG
jgi:hypothetical protein